MATRSTGKLAAASGGFSHNQGAVNDFFHRSDSCKRGRRMRPPHQYGDIDRTLGGDIWANAAQLVRRDHSAIGQFPHGG